MDYAKTLNLPKTGFPMRGNLPQREPETITMWDEMDVYRRVQEKNSGRPKFILHDGPPYANGHIHLGHTLNKVLKDIIVKFYSMSGYDAPYVPGWDTHGLPIEQQAIKSLGINRHEVDVVDFRRRCKEYALKFVDIQREEFKRLGVRGDWERPYLTLMPNFEARQIGVFGEMAKRGYIYKGLKPVYWCATCETALAEAEVEYNDKKSPSIYVKFAVKDGKGILPGDCSVVIWTTTPWTLVANMAIAVHPEFDYVLADFDGEQYVLAKELIEYFVRDAEVPVPKIIKEFKGQDLEGVICRHPFLERDSLVIFGDHVSLEAGTGCVHIAPGHGHEDYLAGLEYNLEILSPVDGDGKFTEEGGEFAGQFYADANKNVIDRLAECKGLVKKGSVRHQYPHCWRCKKPVFFRATEQWFASIEGFRQQALDEIRNVRWIPDWGEERIYNMVANRGDWCISRQRTWGVPIPIFYCAACEQEIINDETIEHLQKIFRKHGSDAWFALPVEDLMPAGMSCPECGAQKFVKETDTMDVWFDSGSSHLGVLDEAEKWPELSWPADLYLEGSDQHRGWFNSSLNTSVAVTGKAPYRSVLTHGFVVDENGRKMSKSLGNVVDPSKVIKQMGADILRLWVTSADYRGDLAASQSILKQNTESYRKIRNTARFILGNLNDFDPEENRVRRADLREIDRWAMLELHKLIKKVTEAYRNYEFHTVYHAVHNFCTVEMSARYLDIVKDTLYCQPAASIERRAVQTVIYDILHALVRLLTPVLAFTSEEIWRYLPHVGVHPESVQLTDMPEADESYIDPELDDKWQRLLRVRTVVNRALETARKDKLIGNSLEAAVILYSSTGIYRFLKQVEGDLPALFIVSTVELAQGKAPKDALSFEELPEVQVSIAQAEGGKCERCWNYHIEVGKNEDYPETCPRCAGVLEEIGYAEEAL